MNITELIEELKKAKRDHGDLPVVASNTGTGEERDMGLVEKFSSPDGTTFVFWVA